MFVDGGEPIEVVSFEDWISDVDWTPDGNFVMYASRSSLWRVSVAGGDPIPFPRGEFAVSVSRERVRLVSVEHSTPTGDIWRIGGPSSSERDPIRFISSSVLDWAPRYSPDGTKIAFASWRAGTENVWICDSEGEDCSQLSETRGILPRWSLDGNRIVFQCRFESTRDICVTKVDGGFTQRLTMDESIEDSPSWSRDGKWIYFASNRSGEFQVWKMPSEGGTPMLVTQNGGKCPLESEDGRFIYYNDNESDPSVWKLPTSGCEPSLVLEAGEVRHHRYWTLWGESIVYRHLDGSRIRMFNTETKQFRTLATFSLNQSRMPFGVTVSPDGQWILVPIWEPEEGDIVLVEDFY
jgi:Tol biopolymer transport system component